LKFSIQRYLTLLVPATLIILADQASKEIIRRSLQFEETWVPWEWLAPYARLVHWRNFGAAFGMFQNGNVILATLAAVVAVMIIYYYPRVAPEDRLLRLALSLQLGGAVGNLIDRLIQGYVTDFISVGTFPVFNIADASISIGAVLLVISVWFKEKAESQKPDEEHHQQSVYPPAAGVGAGMNQEEGGDD
jgi:signal peptidase II